MIDPKGIEKVDDLTVRLKLTKPWAELPAQVGQRYVSIVKNGTTEFTLETLNGTGPFKLDSCARRSRPRSSRRTTRSSSATRTS